MTKSREISRYLSQHGLTPKKWMGQNHVKDPRYVQRILEAARVGPGDRIVEVGAGLGALTQGLVDLGAKVWALEIDRGFFKLLEERFAGNADVVLLHEDALKYGFRELAGELGPLKVVANLPYNISSRLLFRFQEDPGTFQSLCVLLQREVAERLVALPGTKDYGILTVLLATCARVETCFDIPGTAFFPVPKVTSRLIRVTFPDPPPVVVPDKGLLTRLVKAAFSERRKTLMNALKNLHVPGLTQEMLIAAAEHAAIDLRRRGETLSPEEFVGLAESIRAMAGSKARPTSL